MKIFIPCDAAAIAVGADAVASAIDAYIAAEKSRRTVDAQVVRNGSRGLFWLEPLVEVETPAGRVAYGPVSLDVSSGVIGRGFTGRQAASPVPGPHRRDSLLEDAGAADFRSLRVVTGSASIADYIGHDGYRGLERALGYGSAGHRRGSLLVPDYKCRGRRGVSQFGIKWRTVLNTPGDQKYIVCNADEGDSGTYADRNDHGRRSSSSSLVVHDDRWTSGRRDDGLYLCAVRIPACVPNLWKARSPSREKNGYLGSKRSAQRQGFRSGSEARSRRVTFAARRPRCWRAWRASAGRFEPKPPLPAIAGLFGKPTSWSTMSSPWRQCPSFSPKARKFIRTSESASRVGL